VKVNSRIRASSELLAVDLKDANTLQTTRRMTIEIEGEGKPACVAEWLTRLIYG
jgi:acyl dehydratase